MDTADLKEYLNIVVDMEKSIYMQNNLIAKMQNRANQLGKSHTYQEPKKPTVGPVGWPILSIPCIMILVALIFIKSIVGVTFILCGISMVIVMIYGILSAKKEKKTYAFAYSEYEKIILEDQKRINKELSIKRIINSELNLLKNQNMRSRQYLQQIYAKNVIFPKYRSLIFVCSLYEYICSGLCSVLEGHDGAYYILEMNIRLDRIITQNDLILAKLDAIIHYQYMLYSVIQDSTRQITDILNSINTEIKNNLQNLYTSTEKINARISSVEEELKTRITYAEEESAIATYCTQRIQKELEYINHINSL